MIRRNTSTAKVVTSGTISTAPTSSGRTVTLKAKAVLFGSAIAFLLLVVTDDWANILGSSARQLLRTAAINSATGAVFGGEKFRDFTGERHFGDDLNVAELLQNQPSGETLSNGECTNKWSVVTTIFEPSLAVSRAANMEGWCTVIVADTKTPLDYMAKLVGEEEKDHRPDIHFLSVEQQEAMALEGDSRVADFVRALPYKHFARKNLGYLYAIQRGARFIFDFDDDNVVDMLDEQGNVIPLIPNEQHLENTEVVLMTRKIWNPYPLMQASVDDSWPRGFPLEQTLDPTTRGTVAYSGKAVPMEKIGVMQFVADGNPDIDAVHRMTKPLPMTFSRQNEGGKPMVTPLHAFVPYNAQATLHNPKALWATLLPASVPGRVSDIWRSYFAEALFRDYDLRVAFLPPQVSQLRNEHNLRADMDAEEDLYQKTIALTDFLNEWVPVSRTLPGKMEELWIGLYEHGYIEELDVEMVQLWISALIEAGYDFAQLAPRERHHNVVLMGQFNYDQPLEQVQLWAQKWREVFNHVEVVGPFENKVDELKTNGIFAFAGEADHGRESPVANLRDSLARHKGDSRIEGVLYAHDDAVLDMNELTGGIYPFPSNEILFTGSPVKDDYEMEPVLSIRTDGARINHKTFQEQIQSQGKVLAKKQKSGDEPKAIFWNDKHLVDSLNEDEFWGWEVCINPLHQIAHDPRFEKFLHSRAVDMPHFRQSDFVFMPKLYAGLFTELADIFMDHKMYLECAFPTINRLIHKQGHAPLRQIELCTRWPKEVRGNVKMIDQCKREEPGVTHAMYHPFKMAVLGMEDWCDLFDRITHSDG